jgi:hypothetical protein
MRFLRTNKTEGLLVMKRIRRTRITIKTDEMIFVQKGSGLNVALSNEQFTQVCPACGTHILFAPPSPESSAAAEVLAYSAAELPPAQTEHDCAKEEANDDGQPD